mmetsp:Transcript_25798/g.48091  ORF Transcript_25798/g.48091 Transcript_25798/m.48091 type:complete len:446 (+) Transcript_25798:168-1505(+)
MTTVDSAMVHVETEAHKFEQANNDKIAEAEALAAEALRMANEAKRAAERLAEVKRTLAMFSQKLDKVEKTVSVAEAKAKIAPVLVEAEATEAPADPEKEDAPVKEETPVAEEAPVKEEAPAAEETPVKEEPAKEVIKKQEPPTVEPLEPEEKAPVKKAVIVTPAEEAPAPVKASKTQVVKFKEEDYILEEEKKDFSEMFEETLDNMGLDKMCGVDEETLRLEGFEPAPKKIEARKAVAPPTRQLEGFEPAPKKVEAKKAVAPPPPPRGPTTLVEQEKVHQDLIVEIYERSVGRLCGVDDVTLGYALPKAPPAPRAPVPFENSTRLELKEIHSFEEIMIAESWKEKQANMIRKQWNMPPKHFQRLPVNHDFVDPFGVDHDDFAFCGSIADVCEPDLSMLEDEDEEHDEQAPVRSLPAPAPARGILKKEESEEGSMAASNIDDKKQD